MAVGPVVGLDIGTQQIKAVELRPVKGRLTVTGLGIVPTPLGVMQNNIITDPKLMGQTIRQALRQSGIGTKRIICSVAGQNAVVVRIIEVPKMTDAELQETMKWEVERHVPFAPSETVVDYQRLVSLDGPDDDNPNMEILLAVAQQDIITNLIDTLFAAKLDPIAIDIEPLAVARALLELVDGQPVVRPQATPLTMDEPSLGGTGETVAIVNIGASNTDIAIYRDGQLAFPRSLPLAGDSLTRAIAEQMGVSLEQAERAKREHGVVQVERMTPFGQMPYGSDPSYDEPDFGDTGEFAADTAMQNPFDVPEEGFKMGAEGPVFGDLDRTQPISKRHLDIARPSPNENPLPFMPTAGSDDDFGTPFGMGADDAAQRDQIFEAMAPVLSELASELRKTLDFHRSRAQGRSVDRVLLTGGTASLVNLGQYLQDELQVPVVVADPMAGLAVTAKNYDASYLQQIAPAFTVALGLAAREVVFNANPVAKKAAPPRKAKASEARSVTNPPVS